MKLRLSFGIFPKLLVTMLVVTLIPLGAIWYLDYRADSESLSGQIEQRLRPTRWSATWTHGWT